MNTYEQRGKDTISERHVFFLIIAGLMCIASALLYAIFESINRFSGPGQIVLSLGLAGTGILLILMGQNMLFPLKLDTGFILTFGSILSASGILGFILFYPDAWFYPKVAYVMLAYGTGILLLLSGIMLQQFRNVQNCVQYISEPENIDSRDTMSFREKQLTAALSSMMVSQMIHPANEFSGWSSTCHENEIYACDAEIIQDGIEKDETCEIRTSTERVPETMFPETMTDLNPELPETVEGPSITAYIIEKEEATGKDVKNFPSMKSTDIKKDDHMREAAHKILRFHFERMLKHERGTMVGKDIEELHDMRVAAMRMRSVFQVFNGHLDMEVMQLPLKNIRATRRSLGAVRDLDVFMEKIQKYLEELPEEKHTEMDELISTLIIERDKARGLMLLHLDSNKYNKFKQKFSKIMERKNGWEEKLVNKDGLPVPHRVRDVLPPLLYTQLATVRAYDDLVHTEETSYEMLHALRIDVKILRYTMEFFEEVLGEETKGIVKDLKALQDNLGDLHDAVVAVEMLENYLNYGKWGITENSNSDEVALIIQDVGTENYLTYRREEITELIEAFPKVWSRIMDSDFGIRFSSAIASLYQN